MKFVKRFDELQMSDVALVGGKNASLGEMVVALSKQGIRVPMGFAVTIDAYWRYLEFNHLVEPIKKQLASLSDINDLAQLQKVGKNIRNLIEQGALPEDISEGITTAYQVLSDSYNQKDCDVAVRSSATAEDLPTASFAGQQDTYLNVHGTEQLLGAYKKCLASLFNDRAIAYRIEQGFDHLKVALSVGVQKMIRSDSACSGVAFSLDTESGFKDVVMIDASWGLGESIVQGLVIPDEFVVYKPMLFKGFSPIIKKRLGNKKTKIIYTANVETPTQTISTTEDEQKKFTLTDAEILDLAKMIMIIEDHYSQKKGAWSPMDIEWAKDGIDNKLYIIQARPETIHAADAKVNHIVTYRLNRESSDQALKPIITGQSIGQQIVSGTARVIQNAQDIDQIQKGDILVTTMTDPDFVPIMKKAAGIITDQGGRTCHAAIVSRELKIPAIVGTERATTIIKTGQKITLDCSQGKTGFVYDGALSFEKSIVELKQLPKLPVDVMVNISYPDGAFVVGMLPTKGVGLARLEFIITNMIQIHPMACVYPEKISDEKIKQKIEELTYAYSDKRQFFIDSLAQGVAMIGAAFYPRPVIVRLSDFKTNEYRNLIGGSYFEPIEENPMIGFRGASRYYHELYRDAFSLECAAMKKVRDEMGLINVKIMIPFVRTINEAHKVIKEMERHGLQRGKNNLEVYMMCEIPSNVLLIDEFSRLFDGISIGSNDLTQLTLGVDRDSGLLTTFFDERDTAVLKMLKLSIDGAKRNNIHSGICGQAPSDFPEIATFVIDAGIDSISLNPDSVLPFIEYYKK